MTTLQQQQPAAAAVIVAAVVAVAKKQRQREVKPAAAALRAKPPSPSFARLNRRQASPCKLCVWHRIPGRCKEFCHRQFETRVALLQSAILDLQHPMQQQPAAAAVIVAAVVVAKKQRQRVERAALPASVAAVPLAPAWQVQQHLAPSSRQAAAAGCAVRPGTRPSCFCPSSPPRARPSPRYNHQRQSCC